MSSTLTFKENGRLGRAKRSKHPKPEQVACTHNEVSKRSDGRYYCTRCDLNVIVRRAGYHAPTCPQHPDNMVCTCTPGRK